MRISINGEILSQFGAFISLQWILPRDTGAAALDKSAFAEKPACPQCQHCCYYGLH